MEFTYRDIYPDALGTNTNEKGIPERGEKKALHVPMRGNEREMNFVTLIVGAIFLLIMLRFV